MSPRARMVAALADAIDALRRSHTVRVAVDGVDGAGKTALADELAGALRARGRPVVRASVDDFLHPAAVRRRRGDSGETYYRDAFDYDALRAALLAPLGPGGSGRHRRAAFDHRADAPVDAPVERAEPGAVLLLDGVFLHRPELQGAWDFSVFVACGFDTTVARAARRDVGLFGSPERVRARYAARYVPGQRLYLAEAQPEARASAVVDNDDPARPRLRLQGVQA